MPIVFESLSEGFYTAFFEPDLDKRKEKIGAWVRESIPIIKSTVEKELESKLNKYLEDILQSTWDFKGWKGRVQKFADLEFRENYKLNLGLKINISNCHSLRECDVVGSIVPEERKKTNEAAELAKTFIAKLEPPPPIDLREIDLHGNTVEQAIPIAENLLKECYRDNVRRIRIIHGKGIFILQKAIREHLGKHKLIKPESISPAIKDHGGEGATEANLVDFSVDKLD